MTLQTTGISNFTCPARIPEKGGGQQETVATVDLMARSPLNGLESCIEVMTAELGQTLRPDLSSSLFPGLLAVIRASLRAEEAHIRLSFPYFIAKRAPVSGTPSLMEYHCAFASSSPGEEEALLSVRVPVTTLCPCSREISAFGAHNQRAEVTLTVQPRSFIWLEDLIILVEDCGSSEVYALLKRPDEKYLTEYAYTHPMFVEDVARKVAQAVRGRADVAWFSVEVESFESIHKHNAYALVDSGDLEDDLPSV